MVDCGNRTEAAGWTSAFWHALECGGLTPLWSFLSFPDALSGKRKKRKKRKKAVSSHRTPKRSRSRAIAYFWGIGQNERAKGFSRATPQGDWLCLLM